MSADLDTGPAETGFFDREFFAVAAPRLVKEWMAAKSLDERTAIVEVKLADGTVLAITHARATFSYVAFFTETDRDDAMVIVPMNEVVRFTVRRRRGAPPRIRTEFSTSAVDARGLGADLYGVLTAKTSPRQRDPHAVSGSDERVTDRAAEIASLPRTEPPPAYLAGGCTGGRAGSIVAAIC